MYKTEMSYEEFLKREQEKNPELNIEDIDLLKKRVEANVDLPPVPGKMIILFLHGCYFDVDVAYKTIVANYKYRKELPQVFSNFDPASETMKKVFETVIICELTKSCSGKESRVFFTSFKNTDPRQYEYIDTVKYFFMMMDHLLITSGSFDGLILTMNAANMSWRHIARTPMNVMKKILGFVQEALPLRLKEVHILNAGSMVTMLFSIISPFIKSSLMDLLKIYPVGSTDIYKYVPIEIIPSEVGGKGKSYLEYSEINYNIMQADRDWFLSLD